MAKTGGILHRTLDVQTRAIYGTSEFYGCTIVVVMDSGGVVIGHFPEESGNSITLESVTATQTRIIGPLERTLIQVAWTEQAVAYIVHSSRSAVTGLEAIKTSLTNDDIPPENIKESVYTSGLSTVGSRGKVVVTWEPLEEGGAELQLYIQNDNPVKIAMGTRGLEIVRFRSRYYVRWHQYDSYFEGLGAKIVASIPTDPKWLELMQAEYAARENALESHVYTIRDGFEPDYSQFHEFDTLPSEFPQLSRDAEYSYIINLDHEVLTMNHSIHWKLGNIPRQDNLWLRAIAKSVYRYKSTISLDVCSGDHMASPALIIPKPNMKINYDFSLATPRTDLAEARKAFLTHLLASTLIQYKDEIIRYGMEWSPDSFPFRELACSHGWLDEEWASDSAPLLEFGSASHRPGDPPGASPTETIYWLEDVVISLALVTDGEAITKAAAWGIEQGRANFQIIVLSLFEAAFAEVSHGNNTEPFVKISYAVDLSPLRADYCVSIHPRMRPEPKPGMEIRHQRGELIMKSNCTEVAANRRAASKSAGIFPPEMYDRILDFIDYDTWKPCLVVSTDIRSLCLRKYRLDDRMRIVAGPFVRLHRYRKERLVSFDFENMQTGEILPMIRVPRDIFTEEYNWMPVIGSDRRALMLDVSIQFEPGGMCQWRPTAMMNVHEDFGI
ncbi:hypothetical protein BJX99DRAFT_264725 [Aspergillus californicus]